MDFAKSAATPSGAPIASFQAIKHKLADLWCEVELGPLELPTNGAWALSNEARGARRWRRAWRASRPPGPWTWSTVDLIQIHGGVGYTWEYDCHLFYRRAKLLGAALGNAKSWKHKLVDPPAARSRPLRTTIRLRAQAA